MPDSLLYLFPYQFTHFLLSLFAGYLVYRQSKNIWHIVIAILAGTLLIDLDHWIDFYIYVGKIISPFEFFKISLFCPSGKMYIFFHAWEYLPIIYLVIAKIFKKEYLAWAIIVTIAGHLAFDQMTNGTYPGTYFITWRIIKNFDIFRTTWGCLP